MAKKRILTDYEEEVLRKIKLPHRVETVAREIWQNEKEALVESSLFSKIWQCTLLGIIMAVLTADWFLSHEAVAYPIYRSIVTIFVTFKVIADSGLCVIMVIGVIGIYVMQKPTTILNRSLASKFVPISPIRKWMEYSCSIFVILLIGAHGYIVWSIILATMFLAMQVMSYIIQDAFKDHIKRIDGELAEDEDVIDIPSGSCP